MTPIKTFDWTAGAAFARMGVRSTMSTTTMALESPVSLFHRVSSIVSSNLSLEEMLGEILGLTVQATGCDACLVYLIDHEANEMVLRASQVPHAADLGELRIKMG